MSRVVRLDELRGLAVLLMLLDHVLAMGLSHWHWPGEFQWIRQTITRAALPLFMMVAGYLWQVRCGPSWRSVRASWEGAVMSFPACLAVGFGVPDILGLYAAAATGGKLLKRWPLLACVTGLLQALYLPLNLADGRSYEPGLVVAFCCLGTIWARLDRTPLPDLVRSAPVPSRGNQDCAGVPVTSLLQWKHDRQQESARA